MLTEPARSGPDPDSFQFLDSPLQRISSAAPRPRPGSGLQHNRTFFNRTTAPYVLSPAGSEPPETKLVPVRVHFNRTSKYQAEPVRSKATCRQFNLFNRSWSSEVRTGGSPQGQRSGGREETETTSTERLSPNITEPDD